MLRQYLTLLNVRKIVSYLNQLRMVSRNPRLAGFELDAFVLDCWPAIEDPIGIPDQFGGCCVIPDCTPTDEPPGSM